MLEIDRELELLARNDTCKTQLLQLEQNISHGSGTAECMVCCPGMSYSRTEKEPLSFIVGVTSLSSRDYYSEMRSGAQRRLV